MHISTLNRNVTEKTFQSWDTMQVNFFFNRLILQTLPLFLEISQIDQKN